MNCVDILGVADLMLGRTIGGLPTQEDVVLCDRVFANQESHADRSTEVLAVVTRIYAAEVAHEKCVSLFLCRFLTA